MSSRAQTAPRAYREAVQLVTGEFEASVASHTARQRNRVGSSEPSTSTSQALDPPGPLRAPEFAVVDVETTGFVVGTDRVVEIAVLNSDVSGHVIDEWTTMINPEGPVSATAVHGLTTAEVRRAPTFREIVGNLNALLAGRILVTHNARFDLSFITAEYERAGWTFPAFPAYFCTLDASRDYLPSLPHRRLTDCCRAYDISIRDVHSALGDARATAQLLNAYLAQPFPARRASMYRRLPTAAARVRWPTVPVTGARAVPRPARAVPPEPAPFGALWRLINSLPRAMSAGHTVPHARYLQLLFDVFDDEILTEAEADLLAALAANDKLSRDQVDVTHRAFLVALADRIVADGQITHDERLLLETTAMALGVEAKAARELLDEAEADWHSSLEERCRPLPAGWTEGEPLRIKDEVVFTGGGPFARSGIQSRARAQGLRVAGEVSRRTALLVVDPVRPDSRVVRAASDRGIRVVTPEVFGTLVQHVQPAAAGRASRHQSVHASIPMNRPDAQPAQTRR